MNNTTRILLTAVLCTAAVACSKKVKETPPPAETPTTSAPVTDSSGRPPALYGPNDLDTDACLRQRVVYFDFDQDALRPEFQAIVGCHAKYLRDRPSSRMTLEGNADERGSREYNLGLGERRGNAVSSARPGQRRLGQPDHRRQLRRRASGLHRLERGLLGQEPSRRDRLHRQVSATIGRSMRKFVLPVAFAAALVAAAPAFAQRASLADRVAALEQQAATTRATSTCSTRSPSSSPKSRRCARRSRNCSSRTSSCKQSNRKPIPRPGRPPQPARRRRRHRRLPTTAPRRRPASRPPRGATGIERTTARRRSTATPARWRKAPTSARAYDAAFNALKAGDYAESAQPVPGLPRGLPERHLRAQCVVLARRELLRHPELRSWRRMQFQTLLDRYPDPRQGPRRAAQGRPVAVSASSRSKPPSARWPRCRTAIPAPMPRAPPTTASTRSSSAGFAETREASAAKPGRIR